MTDKELEKEADRIVYCLDGQELIRKRCQANLRLFVINKNFPLEKRFNVWKKYCDKKHNDFLIHNGDYGIIGEYVDNMREYFDRYVEYDYEHFFTLAEEESLYPDEFDNVNGLLTPHNMSLDDFKETLIETNFGSFIFDW